MEPEIWYIYKWTEYGKSSNAYLKTIQRIEFAW